MKILYGSIGILMTAMMPVSVSAQTDLSSDGEALGWLVRNCINSAAATNEMGTAISESAYSAQLQSHARNDEGGMKVWSTSDNSVTVTEDKARYLCAVRVSAGSPSMQRTAVKSTIATWYGGAEPVYSTSYPEKDSNQDVFCTDGSAFGSGWYLVLTTRMSELSDARLTLSAMAGYVPDSCASVTSKMGIPQG
ncbi:MAG: hypothetical protein CMK07_00720 [Ponticaulis sp.]|nr:hypothetical protein [Ponticaulis sp.]